MSLSTLIRLARPTVAAPLFLLAAVATPVACAQVQPNTNGSHLMAHPNSIQPETTLNVNVTGKVMEEPDIAFITTGVQAEGETAEAAMAEARDRMNGVFNALEAAGIPERDIQTSNFSLHPRYEYVEENRNGQTRRGRQVLVGYTVSNQVTAKISDLDTVGETLDALVSAGGNTFSGIRFALEDDTEARNQARRNAMQEALERAQLYADAAGYRVARIVTINEYEQSGGPQPQVRMRTMDAEAASAPTPISGGEVGYSVQLQVTFEFTS